MKAPGESAAITYDGWQSVEQGDYLRTQTGRTYLVQDVRVQTRGKHTGRQHLSCVVMAPDHQPEPDATVHPLYWYPRTRRNS